MTGMVLEGSSICLMDRPLQNGLGMSAHELQDHLAVDLEISRPQLPDLHPAGSLRGFVVDQLVGDQLERSGSAEVVEVESVVSRLRRIVVEEDLSTAARLTTERGRPRMVARQPEARADDVR
jgi:hypothetical protein